jgi:DNA-3-methyladenine glycosylase I
LSEPHQRCPWCGDDPLYVRYHDQEWGAPTADGRYLFEKLILEGFQSGLSWIVILRKREAFRAAFDRFDAEKMARYDPEKMAALAADPGIVRNRPKIEAARDNARALLKLRDGGDDFAGYLWGFVDGRPLRNARRSLAEVPPHTPLSQAIAKDLKRRGFRFCGPTTVYAMMQAVGMVNDHLVSCPRHAECAALADGFSLE